MYAVIRIRGINNMNGAVADTLRMMNLGTANSCVLLPETPDVRGMLQKVKDYVTWGEVSKEAVAKMAEKRMRAGDRKVDSKALKDLTKMDSFDALAAALIEGKLKMGKIEGAQRTFRLTPPSGGFKSVNEGYPRGDIGYRGKEIDGLIERMI